MKDIRIYSVGSHQTLERNSGVDYARIYSPMKYLNGIEDRGFHFTVDFFDVKNKFEGTIDQFWTTIADQYDIVYFNYTIGDWQYAHMANVLHWKKKKIVMDVDDAIWYLQPDNVSYQGIMDSEGIHILTSICNDVDYITCTNSYLRNVIADKTLKYHNKIEVFPNQVDLTLYNRTYSTRDTGEIIILHYGSGSHFEDLIMPEFVEGIDRIMKIYPQVRFITVGANIPELKNKWGSRLEVAFGDVDIYKWILRKFPEYMEKADILVTPLRDTIYNRCKSDIHFVEIGSAAKPGVYSNIRPYADTIEHGVTGYLAKTADDWFNSLKLLIEDQKLREKIGKHAYRKVIEDRQQSNHVYEYVRFFRRILDK